MKSSSRTEYLPLILLILLSIIVAALVFTHYGQSWDEDNFFNYARESLNAYANIGNHAYVLIFQDPTLRYYGPWFLMLIVLVGKLFPAAELTNVAHLLTFLVFQGGVVLFYMLARRWLARLPAFIASLLFATQPVLWGHAFINARDIPFMVGFIGTIYFGLRMVDSLKTEDLVETNSKLNATVLRGDISSWKIVKKVVLVIVFLAGIVLLAWLALTLSVHWQASMLEKADTTSARELDLYLRPLLAKFWAVVAFVLLSLAWSLLLFLPFMPVTARYLLANEVRPIFARFGRYLHNRTFVVAAVFLGLTVATRILGAMAGILVLLFLFARHKRGAILVAFIYALLALPIVYITWPYIWSEPLLRLLITLRVMLRFPWPGLVLFDGNLYAGNELPRIYLLKLLLFQLTEPLLLLLAIGVGAILWQLVRHKAGGELLALSALWFGLPVGAALVGRPYLYDNFRQLLFALPPLFLLAGAGLAQIFRLLRNKVIQIALAALVMVPGIWAMLTLHPYEYVYYNSLAGGIAGAQGKYELDYWGISLKAMAAYANENLPQGANVVVWGPPTSFLSYAREDLKVYDSRAELIPQNNFYAVILHRAGWNLSTHRDLASLYDVRVQGISLASIKYVGP